MAFFAIYEVVTGRLRSSTSTRPDDTDLVGKSLAYKEYAEQPTDLWNGETQDFDIPRPAAFKQHKEFLLRFTFQEHVKLLALSKTDDQIEVWVDRMILRENVDQTNTEFKIGMQQLVDNNVITLARAKEIGEWV